MDSVDVCSNCGDAESVLKEQEHFYKNLSPDIPDLISTSFPLLSSELELVHESLPHAQRLLSKFDHQVGRLKAALHAFEIEHRKVQAVVENHKGALCCIRQLPTEILHAIFLHHSYDAWDSSGGLPARLGMNGPWLTSQVCRRWRDIVLTSQALWSHVQVSDRLIEDDLPLDTHLPSIPLHALETWIHRSGNAPLHIRCRESALPDSHWETLMSSGQRWQSLDVDLTESFLKQLFVRREKFSSLRHIRLLDRFDVLQSEFSHIQAIHAFENAPHLSSVTLFGVLPNFIFLPWHQITRVSFNLRYYSTLAGHLSVLGQASNLEECELWASSLPNDSSDSDVLVHTMSKMHLNISWEESAVVLDHFCLPSLRSFTLKGTITPTSIVSLSNLLRRSSCSLKSLRLIGLEPQCSGSIHELFETASTVTDLYLLPAGIWHSELFHLLTNHDMLPQLETLAIDFSTPDLFSTDSERFMVAYSLTRLVSSRLASRSHALGNSGVAVRSLKRIELHGLGQFGADLCRGLEVFEGLGLKVIQSSESSYMDAQWHRSIHF